MRGPRPDRSGSSSFRPSLPLVLALLVGLIVLALVAGVLVLRWRDYRADERQDLGPGPVRGVRLVVPRPGEAVPACPGLPDGLPVVRLVEQVSIERIDLCLDAGLEAPGSGESSRLYRLARINGQQAAQELDLVAATFSLPDQRRPWWQDRTGRECPERYVTYQPYPMVLSVGGQQFWVAAPTTPCGPLDSAYGVTTGVARLARPVG